MSTSNITLCDICNLSEHVSVQRPMQFLRHFDDTDGRTFGDYLTVDRIDICKTCLDRVIESKKFLVDDRVQEHGKIHIQKKDTQ